MIAYHKAAAVFDGHKLLKGIVIAVSEGKIVDLIGEIPSDAGTIIDHGNTILTPGFIDLQVNGGGGILLNDDPTAQGLLRIVKAHRSAGTEWILPTLITDEPENVRRAVSAVENFLSGSDFPSGVLGLHLEGPHFAPSKRGAHNSALIRPMEEKDVTFLLDAARRLPVVLMTLAPDVVPPETIQRLVNGGVLISLGHSNADIKTAKSAFAAGASSITHLYNAMSQFSAREPGLVGAALNSPDVHVGIIADGIHVHPDNVAMAYKLKGSNGLHLVTDAMSCFGTDDTEFMIGDRIVTRKDNRLFLADGTLAGADLTLHQAIRNVMRFADIPLNQALKLVTSAPSNVIGRNDVGHIKARGPAFFNVLDTEGRLIETISEG